MQSQRIKTDNNYDEKQYQGGNAIRIVEEMVNEEEYEYRLPQRQENMKDNNNIELQIDKWYDKLKEISHEQSKDANDSTNRSGIPSESQIDMLPDFYCGETELKSIVSLNIDQITNCNMQRVKTQDYYQNSQYVSRYQDLSSSPVLKGQHPSYSQYFNSKPSGYQQLPHNSKYVQLSQQQYPLTQSDQFEQNPNNNNTIQKKCQIQNISDKNICNGKQPSNAASSAPLKHIYLSKQEPMDIRKESISYYMAQKKDNNLSTLLPKRNSTQNYMTKRNGVDLLKDNQSKIKLCVGNSRRYSTEDEKQMSYLKIMKIKPKELQDNVQSKSDVQKEQNQNILNPNQIHNTNIYDRLPQNEILSLDSAENENSYALLHRNRQHSQNAILKLSTKQSYYHQTGSPVRQKQKIFTTNESIFHTIPTLSDDTQQINQNKNIDRLNVNIISQIETSLNKEHISQTISAEKLNKVLSLRIEKPPLINGSQKNINKNLKEEQQHYNLYGKQNKHSKQETLQPQQHLSKNLKKLSSWKSFSDRQPSVSKINPSLNLNMNEINNLRKIQDIPKKII